MSYRQQRPETTKASSAGPLSQASIDHLDAGRIDAVRLFTEDVFARVDGGCSISDGSGRAGDNDRVDFAGEQLLIRVEAEEAAIVGDTSTWSGLRCAALRQPSSCSGNTSAKATRRMSFPAFIAFAAAPVPRPPQPIRPTLITSLPAAWTLRASSRFRLIASPAPTELERFSIVRRETRSLPTDEPGTGMLMIVAPLTRVYSATKLVRIAYPISGNS